MAPDQFIMTSNCVRHLALSHLYGLRYSLFESGLLELLHSLCRAAVEDERCIDLTVDIDMMDE